MAKMEYEDARRIRNKDYSLGRLITSNIRQGGGVGESIKGAFKEKFDVGTRTKAKMTGIKEKFDPLNIAKFLTFGSNVAPALLGKMTGRSQKDINYFSGGNRAKPYENATKIGQVDGDESGLTDILDKIYTFMKKNQEDDIKHQELQNNHREEELAKDAKRHSDLLKALAKLTGNMGGKETAEKVTTDSGDMSIIDTVTSMLEAFGGLKSLKNIGKLLLRGAGTLAAGAIVGGLIYGVDYLAGKFGVGKDEFGNDLQIDTKKDDANWEKMNLAEKIESGIARGVEKVGDIIDPNISREATATRIKNESEYLKNKEMSGATQVNEAKAPEEYEFDAEGNVIKTPSAQKNTPVNKATINTPQAPAGMEFNPEGGLNELPKASPAKSSPVSAIPAESSNAGQQLVNATNENNNAKLADLTSSPATNTVNSSQTNVGNKSSSPKQPLPPVRNLEDTFQRMIMNSTKVV